MSERSSPWWYRWRSIVFGMIYFLGFVLGGVSSEPQHGYVPAFVQLGSRWGSNGIFGLLTFGVVLTGLCFLLRLWGSSYLSAGIVWNDNARTDALLVRGPFRYTRNPLYLGNLLMAIGIGIMASIGGWIFIVLANGIFIWMLARHEEVGLQERYGAAYERYAASVPWLFPRLTPALATGHAEASLRQGLLSELLTGAMLLGMIAVLFSARVGVLAFFVLYAAGIVAQNIVKRVQTKRIPVVERGRHVG